MSKWFKNFEQIATTNERKDALEIAEAALDAIDTEKVIRSAIKLDGQTLEIQNRFFDLNKFKNIKVIGFGKASCRAAQVLEQILGSKINSGIAIGISPISCEYIKTYTGTHPQPSYKNVEVSKNIMELSQNATAEDLVIVIVSGGGSALLCWPREECDQGQMLYHRFLKSGGNIKELNIVRKHISLLKGGGLAKELYPATVVGLIFSDVPDDEYDMIASGPTYKDDSTMADALKIIEKYQLGAFNLNETPKDDELFRNVYNIPLISNKIALEAMKTTAEKLGYNAKIFSAGVYEDSNKVLNQLVASATNNSAILAGGEIQLVVTSLDGSGGRNLNLAMHALKTIKEADTFLAFASDGLDNSDAAGAIVDKKTIQKAKEQNLDVIDYINRFDGLNLFKKLDDVLYTGPTEANVSDLMFLIRK